MKHPQQHPQQADNERSGDDNQSSSSYFADIRSTPILNTTPSEENASYYSIHSQQQQPRKRRFQFPSRPISFRSFNNNNSAKTSIKSKNSWREKRINWIRQHHLPEFETKIHCDQCEKYVQTRIRYRNGSMVYLMSFIL
jgi:hypothetical protein